MKSLRVGFVNENQSEILKRGGFLSTRKRRPIGAGSDNTRQNLAKNPNNLSNCIGEALQKVLGTSFFALLGYVAAVFINVNPLQGA